ncbi:MAG: penicillin acylase family protein [Blastocatellia bacterium]|nr:penicillin acylase family protein [Blastocatellia bacterium]
MKPNRSRFRWLKYGALSLTGVLLVTAVVTGVTYYRWTRGPLPQLEGEIRLAGLSAPVTVRRDAFGVPHLLAGTLEDALMAQGYVCAQDRLWQMDAMRRAGKGELAEIFGAPRLKYDQAQRRLGFGRIAEQTFATLPPAMQQKLTAYAKGVNAFIETHRDRLPFEFQVLQYEPQPWKPSDSLVIGKLMAQALSTTFPEDLMREKFAATVDEPTFRRLFPSENPLDQVVFGTDTQPAPIPSTLSLAGPVTATPSRSVSEMVAARIPEKEGLAVIGLEGDGLGSNNWVVSGARTTTGKPLLCNDPHLGHGIPSIWFQVHLATSDGTFDAAGVSFPGAPGVVIGHNRNIAWGCTNFAPDVQDLYRETFNPQDPTAYRVKDHWEKAEIRTEIIKVRRSMLSTATDDEPLTVTVTRHGPIVREMGGNRYALRWTALDPVTEFGAFILLDQARNWEDFQAALRQFPGPMQNFIYADQAGNIGYWGAGQVPIRTEGDGSRPLDGASGQGEWTGFIPFEELPHLFNPPAGVIITANQRITGKSDPHFYTHQWVAPYRAAAIRRRIDMQEKLSPDDMASIQADVWSYPEQIFVEEVKKLAADQPADDTWQDIRQVLDQWKGELQSDSPVAAMILTWRRKFGKQLLESKVGPELAKDYTWEGRETFYVSLIVDRPPDWLPKGTAGYPELLAATWRETKTELAGKFGPDRSRWRYGATNTLEFSHPLGAVSFFKPIVNAPVLEMGGSSTTVNAFGRGGVWGVSMRMTVDLQNLDNSRQNLTVGISGHPASPHYQDQLSDWYRVKPHLFAFSPAAVEQCTRTKLVLQP